MARDRTTLSSSAPLIVDIPPHLARQVVGHRAEAGLRAELARPAAAAGPRP